MSDPAAAALGRWVHDLHDPIRAVEEAWAWADALERVGAFDVGGRVFGPLLRRGWVQWIPRVFERPDPHLERLRRADDGEPLTLQQVRSGLRRLGVEEYPEPGEYRLLGRLLRTALAALESEDSELRALVMGWVALHRDADLAVAPFRTAVLHAIDPQRVEPPPPSIERTPCLSPAIARIGSGDPKKRWSRLASLRRGLESSSRRPCDFVSGADDRTLGTLSALFRAEARR